MKDEQRLRCSECGSSKIAIDKIDESRYCKECGTVIEEVRFV